MKTEVANGEALTGHRSTVGEHAEVVERALAAGGLAPVRGTEPHERTAGDVEAVVAEPAGGLAGQVCRHRGTPSLAPANGGQTQSCSGYSHHET